MKQAKYPLLRNMADIIARARELNSSEQPHRVAVAAAHDEAVIEAVVSARREGIADALLFGDQKQISNLLRKQGVKRKFEIIHAPEEDAAGEAAAAAVSEGRADIV